MPCRSWPLTDEQKATIHRLRASGQNGRLSTVYITKTMREMGHPISDNAIRKELGLAVNKWEKERCKNPKNFYTYTPPKMFIPPEIIADRDRRANLARMPFGDPPPGSGLSALEKRNGTTP